MNKFQRSFFFLPLSFPAFFSLTVAAFLRASVDGLAVMGQDEVEDEPVGPGCPMYPVINPPVNTRLEEVMEVHYIVPIEAGCLSHHLVGLNHVEPRAVP